METKTRPARNTYGAHRVWMPALQKNYWRGWMTYADATTDVIETPAIYGTKARALAAIKGQHPSR